MSQSVANILVHFIFSTKDRRNFIHIDFEEGLHKYMTGICNKHDCRMLQINGMPDHVHMLVNLSKNIAAAQLVLEIKTASSKWMKSQDPKRCSTFSWQPGYGAFSVSPSTYQDVIDYISNQKVHHKKKSFKDEFRSMLDMAGIEYDERYIWT